MLLAIVQTVIPSYYIYFIDNTWIIKYKYTCNDNQWQSARVWDMYLTFSFEHNDISLCHHTGCGARGDGGSLVLFLQIPLSTSERAILYIKGNNLNHEPNTVS